MSSINKSANSIVDIAEKKQKLNAEFLDEVPVEITDWEREKFAKVISFDLDEDQVRRITEPAKVYPIEKHVLAVHWHPEHVPMPLARKRIDNTFPNKKNELIIPTQHNIIEEYDNYAGVEVDSYSREFNLKVQLLVHFKKDRLKNSGIFRQMLDHTYKYRETQLFELFAAFINPDQEYKLNEAANEYGLTSDTITFVQKVAKKLHTLLLEDFNNVPKTAMKNKLFRNFFDELRPFYGNEIIDLAQVCIKQVKGVVKRYFNNDYFYLTQEVIEEVRGLGGCMVIPHPEQFWPILLADYDVDGYEVWNPQSRQYTDFLIDTVNRKNKSNGSKSRHILIFMGDDCHLGEKVRPVEIQDREKARREIGVQHAWEDVEIRKHLIFGNVSKESIINEYKARLAQ